ncbi:hypothetical protein GQ600_8535 [Phytophthora cactorum]|nr:hypothetical protein GQ600_8535 [Phytophthora cactorum]
MLDRVTAPNDLGALQPAAICQLTYSSFPVESKKTKGDYQPPQAHALAASRMFKQLTPMNGKIPSPMSFYQGLREAEGMAFSTTLAVLMAVFSGRCGASGPTILHFKTESEAAVLEAGSSNGNFASDFSPTAALPRAVQPHDQAHGKAACLCGLKQKGGPISLGCPGEADATVRQQMARLDDPSWWVRFCRATDTVNFHAKDWSRGLVNALHQDHRLRRGHDHDQRSRAYGAQWEMVGTRSGQRDVPDHIRALILVNRNGEQPCLSNLGGVECSGGSRDRCGHPSRVHNWREHVPRCIREWVDHAYRREKQRLEREHRDRARLDNGRDRRDDRRNAAELLEAGPEGAEVIMTHCHFGSSRKVNKLLQMAIPTAYIMSPAKVTAHCSAHPAGANRRKALANVASGDTQVGATAESSIKLPLPTAIQPSHLPTAIQPCAVRSVEQPPQSPTATQPCAARSAVQQSVHKSRLSSGRITGAKRPGGPSRCNPRAANSVRRSIRIPGDQAPLASTRT